MNLAGVRQLLPNYPVHMSFFEGRFSEDGLLNRTKRAFRDPNFLPFQVA